MVVVAQLVRALVCGTRSRRFEPGLPPENKAFLNGKAFFVDTSIYSLEVYPERAYLREKGMRSRRETGLPPKIKSPPFGRIFCL